jgi:protein-disulfide isomerase
VTSFYEGVPQQGATLGDANAPVTITEFGDLRCPVCRQFALETEDQMIGTFVKPGKAKFVFRIWPILGTDSVSAAACGIAAQQQNALFQYQDLWYRNQQDENTEYATPAFCDGIAKALDLDLTQFEQDRQDDALWTPEVQDVQVVAAQENFGGTPSFIVEGPKGRKVLSGSLPTIKDITDAVKAVQ